MFGSDKNRRNNMREKGKEQESVAIRPTTIDTIIGENTTFEGTITATTTLRIDGIFKGDIKSQSTVIVGETGKVIGTVAADCIFISGNVDGKITIADKTEFSSTGYLDGEIATKLLIIAEGASFDGRCKMKKKINAKDIVAEREAAEAKEAQGGQNNQGAKDSAQMKIGN